jgi:hypothetical protein
MPSPSSSIVPEKVTVPPVRSSTWTERPALLSTVPAKLKAGVPLSMKTPRFVVF